MTGKHHHHPHHRSFVNDEYFFLLCIHLFVWMDGVMVLGMEPLAEPHKSLLPGSEKHIDI